MKGLAGIYELKKGGGRAIFRSLWTMCYDKEN